MRLLAFLLVGTLAFSAPSAAWSADERPKKKAKKKAYDYEQSKYKAYKALTEDQERTYRFNERGEPVKPGAKKKKAKKPAKKSSEAEDAGASNCEADQTCEYQRGT